MLVIGKIPCPVPTEFRDDELSNTDPIALPTLLTALPMPDRSILTEGCPVDADAACASWYEKAPSRP